MMSHIMLQGWFKKYAALTVLVGAVWGFGWQSQSQAETIARLAQQTHIHGISFNRSGGAAVLILATHHGMVAVDKSGSVVPVSSRMDFMGFAADPSNPLRYFSSGHPATGGNSGFMASEDGGATWSKLSDGAGGPVDFHGIAVSAADPLRIYGVFRGIQESRDGGQTWEFRGTVPKSLVALAASARVPGRLFAATQMGLKVSNDIGATWQNAGFEGEVVSAIHISSTGTALLAVIGRGLLSSDETDLNDWTQLAGDFGESIALRIAVDPNDPDHMVLTTQKNEILETQNGGRDWKPFGETAQ